MKIKMLQIGKTQHEYLSNGIGQFEKRLRNYVTFTNEVIPVVKMPLSAGADQLKLKEGELILSRLRADDKLILLDERGKSFNSLQFSEFLQQQMNQGIKQIVFVIGGAYGFSPAVYEKASDKVSLSAMTFSHQLIRLIFMEQLYRGMTILNNHPYHNE